MEIFKCTLRSTTQPRHYIKIKGTPDVTKGHLTPSEFSWVSATGSCATPVVVVNNVGWSVLYDVRVL
jgi:hypothetical protein